MYLLINVVNQLYKLKNKLTYIFYYNLFYLKDYECTDWNYVFIFIFLFASFDTTAERIRLKL